MTASPTIRAAAAAALADGAPRLARLTRRSTDDSHDSRYFEVAIMPDAVEIIADDGAIAQVLPGFRDLIRDVPGVLSVEVAL